MRGSRWVALGLVVVGGVLWTRRGSVPAEEGSVSPSPAVTAPAVQASTEELPRGMTRLRLLTRAGQETSLTIDEGSEAVVLATWCAYSVQLDRVLQDPRARPYLRGKRLVYVLGYDELDRYARAKLKGEAAPERIEDFLAAQPPGARVVEPTFFDRLATPRVYFYDARHPIDHGGYPAAYSGPPNRFRLNYLRWLEERLGMPHELVEALRATYPLGEG